MRILAILGLVFMTGCSCTAYVNSRGVGVNLSRDNVPVWVIGCEEDAD